MPSWLKKAFSKKDEREPSASPATRPSTSGAESSPQQQSSRQAQSSRYPSQRSSSTPSSSSRIYSGVVNTGGGAPLPRTRISTHDLNMAAVTLGVAPPPSPPPVQYSPSGSSSSTPAAGGSLRPDLQQQQIDYDLAMAYNIARQESGSSNNNNNEQQRRMQPAPPQPPSQRSLPPVNHQQHPAMPMTSPFGEAVSLPPPAAGTRPDLAMAAALAESQFTARQADELARTTEAVYQAAVNKALEASLQTVNYDDLLRDIKLWVIDLAASTDDVLAALDSIVRQRKEVAVRLEKALENSEDYDERKIRKLSWIAEQLPSTEDKLRNLADKMMPIGVAVVELQDLRDHVVATSPPLEEAGRERDLIVTRLFNAMEKAGLRPPSRSDGEVDDHNGAGPSTSRPVSPTTVQAPADLRDLVAALIDEAQKLPKMPRKKSSGSIATSATTATTSLADPSEIRELPMTLSNQRDGAGNSDAGEGTPQSIPFVATGVAAAVSGVAALNLANVKGEIEEEEEMQQPSAPEADQEEQDQRLEHEQVELSLDVLPTPIGNDLISSVAKEEIIEPDVTATATSGLLQPHRLENFEDDDDEEVPQQEPTLTATTLTSVPPPPSREEPQEEQLGTTTDAEVATSEEKKEKEQTVLSKRTPLWRRLSSRSPTTTPTPGSTSTPSSSIPSATSTPSGSRRTSISPGTFTTPVPFQLSSSRWKAKGPSEAPTAADTLRRLPALISLHYEMEKDSGVVADAVGWTRSSNNDKGKIELGPAVAVAPPAALSSSTTFESPEEMVTFVKAQPEHSFPVTVPSRFNASSRWSVMCAAAGAHEVLTTAIQELSSWETQTTSVVSESHRLIDYLARVSSILSTVANTHDPLHHAVVKHRLPWEQNLTAQVRWAAQHAGIAVMSLAIEASEEAERTKGAWQRQAVLKPLGHGVMAAFSVHQLAGGFGTEAAAVCDYLVERTVHYARMIDPKWFRGHKVVSS